MKNKYDCVVLTYDVPHRKTYDVLCLLKSGGGKGCIGFCRSYALQEKFFANI